jgi:hypothetical protein
MALHERDVAEARAKDIKGQIDALSCALEVSECQWE